MNTTVMNTSHVRSISCFALTLYSMVMEHTQGKARAAAECLCAITSLEFDGGRPAETAYTTLALMALSDLALHAPGVKIIIANWPEDYGVLVRNSSECKAQQMASILQWAECRWDNIQLGIPAIPAVNYQQAILPSEAISRAMVDAIPLRSHEYELCHF